MPGYPAKTDEVEHREVYILKLNNLCWYVGETKHFFGKDGQLGRIDQHEGVLSREGKDEGAKWVQRHRPIVDASIRMSVPRLSSHSDKQHHNLAKHLEHMVACELIKRYGINRVRGGDIVSRYDITKLENLDNNLIPHMARGLDVDGGTAQSILEQLLFNHRSGVGKGIDDSIMDPREVLHMVFEKKKHLFAGEIYDPTANKQDIENPDGLSTTEDGYGGYFRNHILYTAFFIFLVSAILLALSMYIEVFQKVKDGIPSVYVFVAAIIMLGLGAPLIFMYRRNSENVSKWFIIVNIALLTVGSSILSSFIARRGFRIANPYPSSGSPSQVQVSFEPPLFTATVANLVAVIAIIIYEKFAPTFKYWIACVIGCVCDGLIVVVFYFATKPSAPVPPNVLPLRAQFAIISAALSCFCTVVLVVQTWYISKKFTKATWLNGVVLLFGGVPGGLLGAFALAILALLIAATILFLALAGCMVE